MLDTDTSRKFREAYREAVRYVLPFFPDSKLELIARHNPGWRPGRFDVSSYLDASAVRYAHAVELFVRRNASWQPGLRVLDVGGFFGVFPLALSMLGASVTVAEKYSYYYGAFDELRAFLEDRGVTVLDTDFTVDRNHRQDRTFELVTNMAMLEHLANSPRVLMQNLRNQLQKNGRLIMEVPNVAYWPKRVQALVGRSIHPPLRDLYESETPYTGHHREYTAQELRDLLSWSDFVVEELISFNYTPASVGSWKQRLLLQWPSKHLPSCREVLMVCASVRS